MEDNVRRDRKLFGYRVAGDGYDSWLTKAETPPLEPPNGHPVSNAELYKALWTLDQRLGERDTSLLNLIGGIRADFSLHTKDGHPWTQQASVVREEIKLDAKKAGLAAAILAFLTVLASGVSTVLTKWVF